jgi:hypothetical protein
MYSYADTFEQPAVEEIGGNKVTIPLLSQRDYLPWIEELTKKRQETGKANAPPVGKTMERAKWLDYIDNMELTPADLQPYVLRASGTIKVLELALAKAKISDEDAKAFIDGRGAKANEMLAVRVSGLFRREEIRLMYPVLEKEPEKPDPNASPTNQAA